MKTGHCGESCKVFCNAERCSARETAFRVTVIGLSVDWQATGSQGTKIMRPCRHNRQSLGVKSIKYSKKMDINTLPFKGCRKPKAGREGHFLN